MQIAKMLVMFPGPSDFHLNKKENDTKSNHKSQLLQYLRTMQYVQQIQMPSSKIRMQMQVRAAKCLSC